MDVGRYRLGRLLGEGASGVVHEAVNDDGRRVAVKLLRPELAADAALRARFAREARLAGEIRSRHVAPILELGDGFLVLPLYEGGSLAARLERGPLSAAETASLAAQLGRGLDALHEHGIVHRDVKPSNVLFAADGTAAIADFGLARSSGSTRLTLDGQLLGTPAYLAPELIEGAEASAASDVYALGCVLYECAAGGPPFAARSSGSTRLTLDGQLLGTPAYLAPELIEGAEANAASDVYALGCVLYECAAGGPPFAARHLAELGFAHLTEPPPDPRERRPGLPADFALALLTALEKEPSARPTTATALARMLHTAARG